MPEQIDVLEPARRIGIPDEMLLRSPEARGTKVKLGDGNMWVVPSHHFIPREPTFKRDEDGTLKVEVHLNKGIEEGLNVLIELHLNGKLGEELEFNWEPVFVFLFEVLKLNYPGLTPELANKLKIFNSLIVGDFLEAVAGKGKAPA